MCLPYRYFILNKHIFPKLLYVTFFYRFILWVKLGFLCSWISVKKEPVTDFRSFILEELTAFLFQISKREIKRKRKFDRILVIKIDWHREIFSSVTTSVAVPVVRVLCEFTQWPPAESLIPSLQGRPHGGWAGQGAEPVPGGPPARPPAPTWGSPSTGPTSWAAGLQNQGIAAKKVVFLTNNLLAIWVCRFFSEVLGFGGYSFFR